MSTDIVHWQKPAPGELEEVVSSGAIKMFLIITVPLMIFTFAFAIGLYYWNKLQERKRLGWQATELAGP